MLENRSDHLAGKRVLVVEDERMIALYMRDLLEGWGCEVIGPTRSVAEAFDLIDEEHPHAALLDYDLVHENSERLAEALETRDCPFAVITAMSPRHLGPHAARAPRVGKPVDEARLSRVLADLLTSGPGEDRAGDR